MNSKNFQPYCAPFAMIRDSTGKEHYRQKHAPSRKQPESVTPPSRSKRLTKKGDSAINKEFNTPWD